MRSGSSSSRYFAADSCACLSGPPVRRTLPRCTGFARTRSSAIGDVDSDAFASPNGAKELSATLAAVAADACRNVRRLVSVMIHLLASRNPRALLRSRDDRGHRVAVLREGVVHHLERRDPVRVEAERFRVEAAEAPLVHAARSLAWRRRAQVREELRVFPPASTASRV